ncbi:ferritin-like fold-containing protein [Tsukamurella sp. 8F]|uniref:ferritin-like fold-containing protein n=1 Tax=unclassified Tsukamurella TaxID=2633480 RepID=UPI0023B88B0D|nr:MULTISPECIES: ferritin-like fold-containing protein [unclassified Tsukamurella]MDF0528917.1 ferritin-like fold-containing protein [Tsukamurella sp. 8J]MDF0586752.1 ferritin-like fold-containing protein [Tsukamurella sp. 8F]
MTDERAVENQSDGAGGAGPDGGPEHPGIAQLFAVLASGEILAFERLAKEADLAPDRRGRIAFASMAAAEMAHFETLQAELERRGLDVIAVTEPYMEVLTRYHARTTPRNWYEALVKAYIGDGLAADFYTQILPALPAASSSVVEDTLSGTGHSEFVVPQVRSAVVANPALRSPLTLWGRRLLSEAIVQAQEVLATRDELAAMLFESSGEMASIAEFFDTAQEHHARRMAALGLG